VPGLFAALWRAHKAGDGVERTKAQERITAARKGLVLGEKNWIAGLMYSLEALDIGRGNALRPIEEVSNGEKREVEAVIAAQVKTEE